MISSTRGSFGPLALSSIVIARAEREKSHELGEPPETKTLRSFLSKISLGSGKFVSETIHSWEPTGHPI